MRATAILIVAAVCADQLRPAATPPTIPLCAGLTIVTAISEPAGDYETIKTIESIDDQAVSLRVSAQRRVQSVVRNFTIRRAVLRTDLRTATLYMHNFETNAPVTIPGSTALGISSALLRLLKTAGRAELGLVDAANSALTANPAIHPNVYDYRLPYTLARRSTSPTTVQLVVNDARVEVAAVSATGDYVGDKAEFLFLDDEQNPLTLSLRIANSLALQVIRVSYRCDATTTGTSRIERALVETGRAEIYDLYFDFASDRIRDESVRTLDEIGAVLRRHPEWTLAIEGHTDGIASDGYNLDLSRRRADAVKAALVSAYAVAASRLSTAGYGKSRPKDTNDTLEGRARNRRVELVRR